MPRLLVEDIVKLNNLDVKYRVFGEKPDKNNPVFVLDLQNLFYSTKHLHSVADQLGKIGSKLPAKVNVINIDFPGVGESSESDDPKNDYTIERFTEAAARAIEAVKEKYQINSLQLVVNGILDSTKVAMNVLASRPKWASEDSPIRLRLFMLRFPQINGTSILDEVKRRCADDPKLPQYVKAINKLENGMVENNADFIKNVMIPITPLQMKNDVGFFTKFIVGNFPNAVARFLKFLRVVSPSQNLRTYLTMGIDSLQGCHTKVLNQCYGTGFGGFDSKIVVASHIALFRKVPTVFISANDSVLAPKSLNADVLAKMLPNAVNYSLPGKEFENNFAAEELMKEALDGSFVKNHPVPDEFAKQYETFDKEVLHSQQVAKSSTSEAFKSLDVKIDLSPAPTPVVKVQAATAPVVAQPQATPQQAAAQVNQLSQLSQRPK